MPARSEIRPTTWAVQVETVARGLWAIDVMLKPASKMWHILDHVAATCRTLRISTILRMDVASVGTNSSRKLKART